MRFDQRVSARRQPIHPETASSASATKGEGNSQTAKRTNSGLTSSRNPERHGLPIQEAIGLLSWGALSFAATLFIRVDSPREIVVAGAMMIFLITWTVTALASRTVRLFPVRTKGGGSDQRR